MDFEKSLLAMELRWAAHERDRALRQIRLLRRTILFNYGVIALYAIVGLWYAYLAIMTDKGLWHLIYTAIWTCLIGIFLWNIRNSRRSIDRWQGRVQAADETLEKNSKEYEKYT